MSGDLHYPVRVSNLPGKFDNAQIKALLQSLGRAESVGPLKRSPAPSAPSAPSASSASASPAPSSTVVEGLVTFASQSDAELLCRALNGLVVGPLVVAARLDAPGAAPPSSQTKAEPTPTGTATAAGP